MEDILDRLDRAAAHSSLAKEASAEIRRFQKTLRGIRDADWRTWGDGLNTQEEFERWVRSRANHVLHGGI